MEAEDGRVVVWWMEEDGVVLRVVLEAARWDGLEVDAVMQSCLSSL